MADMKISGMPAAGVLTGDELYEGVQAGATVRVRGRNISRPRSVEVTASLTLAASHEGVFIHANHASTAINITVPPNSSVAFAVDTEIHIRQAGAAAVAIVAGSGVTVSQPASQTKSLKEQYAVATLKKVSTDAWALFGMLGAA
jgi:hypothetical protein